MSCAQFVTSASETMLLSPACKAETCDHCMIDVIFQFVSCLVDGARSVGIMWVKQKVLTLAGS